MAVGEQVSFSCNNSKSFPAVDRQELQVTSGEEDRRPRARTSGCENREGGVRGGMGRGGISRGSCGGCGSGVPIRVDGARRCGRATTTDPKQRGNEQGSGPPPRPPPRENGGRRGRRRQFGWRRGACIPACLPYQAFFPDPASHHSPLVHLHNNSQQDGHEPARHAGVAVDGRYAYQRALPADQATGLGIVRRDLHGYRNGGGEGRD